MALYEKTLYTIPNNFVLGNIYEYDISKANISILLAKGIISMEDYERYVQMDRMERQIKIGILQRDNAMAKKILEDGFLESRRLLFTNNNIQNDEVISIKKDAVFVTRPLGNTVFGFINFALKNEYKMMLKIDNPKYEFYFAYDEESECCNIDIKGVKDDSLPLHNDTWIQFFCNVFTDLQYKDFSKALAYINDFGRKYINMQLPIEYYREFNSKSHFMLHSGFVSEFSIDRADDSIRGSINPEFNYRIIRSLLMLVSEMYMMHQKKGRGL